MKIYHASLHQDITDFWPLTHFGARESALAAAAAKYFDKKNREQKAPAWLYEVELDCQDSEFLDCEDFGTPTARAVLNGMKASLEKDDQIKLKAIMGVFSEFQNKGVSGKIIDSVALGHIDFFLRRLGKTVFRYKNVVEAAGMTSYCLFSCSNLKLCSKTQIDFDDLCRGYELLNTCRQNHLIHPDQW